MNNHHFKFAIDEYVKLTVSGEMGKIQARANYKNQGDEYFVVYVANGTAAKSWFREFDLEDTKEESNE